MGTDRYGQHLSVDYVSAPRAHGRSRGHVRDRCRAHVRADDRGRAGNRGRGREVLGAWGLLRDVVAGDYLAITLKVHAASKHQPGFYFALQLITDWFAWVFE